MAYNVSTDKLAGKDIYLFTGKKILLFVIQDIPLWEDGQNLTEYVCIH